MRIGILRAAPEGASARDGDVEQIHDQWPAEVPPHSAGKEETAKKICASIRYAAVVAGPHEGGEDLRRRQAIGSGGFDGGHGGFAVKSAIGRTVSGFANSAGMLAGWGRVALCR